MPNYQDNDAVVKGTEHRITWLVGVIEDVKAGREEACSRLCCLGFRRNYGARAK